MEASRIAEDRWFWRYKVLKMYRILYFRCAESQGVCVEDPLPKEDYLQTFILQYTKRITFSG